MLIPSEIVRLKAVGVGLASRDWLQENGSSTKYTLGKI